MQTNSESNSIVGTELRKRYNLFYPDCSIKRWCIIDEYTDVVKKYTGKLG